jgi:WD40 repeat protein
LAAATGQSNALHSGVTVLRADGSGVRVQHDLPELNVAHVSFSPDGSHVLMGMWGESQIWRADFTGDPVVLPLTTIGESTALYHPRGEMIMTGDKLQFWALDGHERAALARPGGGWNIAWSPDGERIAVDLRDGSVRITRVDGSDEPIVLRGHGDAVTGVAFLPDGRLATSGGNTVKLWSLDWRDLVASLRAATTACLQPAERIKYLDEPEATARAAWEACERRYGRTP